jgi:hypothetical protein
VLEGQSFGQGWREVIACKFVEDNQVAKINGRFVAETQCDRPGCAATPSSHTISDSLLDRQLSFSKTSAELLNDG